MTSVYAFRMCEIWEAGFALSSYPTPKIGALLVVSLSNQPISSLVERQRSVTLATCLFAAPRASQELHHGELSPKHFFVAPPRPWPAWNGKQGPSRGRGEEEQAGLRASGFASRMVGWRGQPGTGWAPGGWIGMHPCISFVCLFVITYLIHLFVCVLICSCLFIYVVVALQYIYIYIIYIHI